MTIALGRLAEVNPAVPEFDAISDDSAITFMPLEACWADGRADFARRAAKSAVANGYTRFRDGDVLLPKITPTFEAGRVFQTNIETRVGAATTEVHVLRARPNADPRYLAYVARSQPFLQLGAASLQGVGNLRRVTTDFVRTYPVATMGMDHQSKIADYLDRETAQIDTLIAKQEQLIRMLRERRIAVVDHTLRDLIPMPETVMTPIRHLGATSSGSGFPPAEQGQRDLELPFFKVRHLSAVGDLTSADDTISVETATKLRATVFPPGTICYAKVGAALLLGRFRRTAVSACLDNNMSGLVPNDRVRPEFLMWALTFVRFDALVNPGAVPSLSDRKFVEWKLPVPSAHEQVRVDEYLRTRTSSIDTLIAKAEQFIELSKERRAALITAVVTGQIEVPEQALTAATPPAIEPENQHPTTRRAPRSVHSSSPRSLAETDVAARAAMARTPHPSTAPPAAEDESHGCSP